MEEEFATAWELIRRQVRSSLCSAICPQDNATIKPRFSNECRRISESVNPMLADFAGGLKCPPPSNSGTRSQVNDNGQHVRRFQHEYYKSLMQQFVNRRVVTDRLNYEHCKSECATE